MSFIYGLAVILVIFEGIIIQCECGCAFSSNVEHDAPPINDIQYEDEENIDTKIDLSIFSKDVIQLIFSKTDFRTVHGAIQKFLIPPNNIVMSRILQNYIIYIRPDDDIEGEIYDISQSGEFLLKISSYKKLLLFFKRFGNQIKKIQICYSSMDDSVPHKLINENIIKKYAKNFELLRLSCGNDERFWEELSDGNEDIIFPQVKNIEIRSGNNRIKFKLNLIFPKLESLTLYTGEVGESFLENVKGLKELTLYKILMEEDKLDPIFANNGNMTKIYLSKPKRTETMESIANHLTQLKTLEVQIPGQRFLLRANQNAVLYEIPSVIHFIISFSEMNDIFGIRDLDLSFEMPHLKKLTLNGCQADDRIVKFIQHFKELETVELFILRNAVECMEKLKDIKEFTAFFDKHTFDLLKNMFENFDKNSKLQTLKFVNFGVEYYQKYEDTIKEFNIQLKIFEKPTWTASLEVRSGRHRNYLVLRREPCTCKSCKK